MRVKKANLSRTCLTMGVAFCALVSGATTAVADSKFELPKWNQLEYGDHHTLGINGYFRTSKGWDDRGKDILPVFIAPGAQSRFRLGNESDTNLEVGLDYRYHLDGKAVENGRYIQLYGMLSDYDSNPNYSETRLEFEEDSNPQSFIRLGNFLDEGTNIWFGRRYYGRRDIHMNDHFWLNVSQGAEVGGGIEGINVGPGTLDVAAFKNEDDEVLNLNQTVANTTRHDLTTYTLDVRYNGIDTFEDGDLTLWGLYAHRPEMESIGFDKESGFAVGGWHTQRNLFTKDRMVTGFQYRENVALQQGLFNSRSVREDQGYDLDEAFAIEINNDYLMEPSEDFAMQWATVVRHESRGTRGVGGDSINWAQTGIRPVYYFNDNISLATEIGVDYVDNQITDQEGFLGKGTVALQLAQDRGYWERPMIKLFVTGASWSNDFVGSVGFGNPAKVDSYASESSAITGGIQFEVWW